MKKYVSMLLVLLLLLTWIAAGSTVALAAEKVEETRAIAIVFDNSGSMYTANNMAWCRATYAMEVFASMLNKGDVLQIYPMWPISVSGKEYTMNNPFQVTDAAQASQIREIFTPLADGTPIETIDCAATGIQEVQADKKYMIVLTDGDNFDIQGAPYGAGGPTQRALDECFKKYADRDMTIMYLGIGSQASIPNTAESEKFVKKKAADNADVLSTLTEMCNQIFGRDTLPENRISGETMEFDISMKKLIVFVQGEDVSDLKIIGETGTVGELVSTNTTRYSTAGAGNYEGGGKSVPDTSLQGMMVTYTDCAAGSYTIDYTGSATSLEVYYEPDADLEFVFTDAAGNNVDSGALFEGDYKVSYGMVDAKTKKLIESDLLGNPHYEGSYFVNGVEESFSYDGYSGETPVSLKKDDIFEAGLTVNYLSGYTITKDSSDFGWPESGIQVATRPAGDLVLEITGGAEAYDLKSLPEGVPYIAKVFYQGTQLTGKDLESTELKWDPDTSNAELKKFFTEDCYELTLHHKDETAPENTVCGPCTVDIYAFYAAPGCAEAEAVTTLTYNIEDTGSPLQLDLYAPQTYIVMDEMDESQPIVARLLMNGLPMSEVEFAATEVSFDCGGLDYTAVKNESESLYLLQLKPSAGMKEGPCTVKATAVYTDQIGRETEDAASVRITLGTIPLWMKWLIRGVLLLLAIILLVLVLRIKVLPKHLHTTKKNSNLNFDGEDVTNASNFLAELKQKQVKAQGQYGGRKFGIVMNVVPGPESYLYKSQSKRSALVDPGSVKKFGPAKIMEVTIGSARYAVDEDTGKLKPVMANPKPFLMTNGMAVKYSGTLQDAGVEKDLDCTMKLNFKKKKK